MQPEEYAKLDAIEDSHWWFHGLRANLTTALQRAAPQAIGCLLDAGCGTGATLRHVRSVLPLFQCVGMDVDEGACNVARAKSGWPICAASVNQLPFRDASLDAIVSADVLCHSGVDVDAALADFHRTLRPGGVLILSLPAYQWMMSFHDRAVSTVRRFDRKQLQAWMQTAGYRNVRITYWNTLLFPVMMLHRKLSNQAASSDVRPVAAPIDAIFRFIMWMENRLLRWGIMLPFGGSVLVTAERP
ncbi:MAG: class I SAM-dependent methyltransferase [Hyphomonadaceae bacterium]